LACDTNVGKGKFTDRSTVKTWEDNNVSGFQKNIMKCPGIICIRTETSDVLLLIQ